MIVCPVCEHAQAQGAECDVCGKKLLHGAAAIPLVPPVEGLEPTRHADVDAPEERLGELEPTLHAAGADAPLELVPGVEETRAAPVDVAVETTPDVERIGDEIPADAPTEVPLLVTCRYCRTQATAGDRVCGRCGMRLPVFEAGPAPEEAPVRRCSCGAAVRGSLCPACGARPA
jgi:hypothetical protein